MVCEICAFQNLLQVHLGDIVGLVLDQCNKDKNVINCSFFSLKFRNLPVHTMCEKKASVLHMALDEFFPC